MKKYLDMPLVFNILFCKITVLSVIVFTQFRATSKKDHTVADLYILSLPSTVCQNYKWVKTVVLYQAVLIMIPTLVIQKGLNHEL